MWPPYPPPPLVSTGESEGTNSTASPASQASIGSAGTMAQQQQPFSFQQVLNQHQPHLSQPSSMSVTPQVSPPQTSRVPPVASTSMSNGTTTNNSSSNTGRGKRRKWTAEERHEHSVVEKKRREDFNILLLDLARRLPNISGKGRPNKRVVVQGALSHVDAERQLILDALPDMKALIEERDSLLKELNTQRARLGLSNHSQRVDTSRNIEKLNKVEAYAYSAFANGLGSGHGNEGDEQDDPSPQSNTSITAVQQPAQQAQQSQLPATQSAQPFATQQQGFSPEQFSAFLQQGQQAPTTAQINAFLLQAQQAHQAQQQLQIQQQQQQSQFPGAAGQNNPMHGLSAGHPSAAVASTSNQPPAQTQPSQQSQNGMFPGPEGTSHLSPNSFFNGIDFSQFLNSSAFAGQSPVAAGVGSAGSTGASSGPGAVSATGNTLNQSTLQAQMAQHMSPQAAAFFSGNAAAAFDAFSALYGPTGTSATQQPDEALSPLTAFLQSNMQQNNLYGISDNSSLQHFQQPPNSHNS